MKLPIKSILNGILLAIKGAIVGVGAILPGVSGGVLLVAFGIYEPMMALFTNPIKSFKTYYKMFIPFLIGWALGFVFLAKGVEFLFAFSPTIALMLFFGLICGTLPELFKKSELSGTNKSWTPFIISLAIAFLLFQILEGNTNAVVPSSFLGFVLSGFIWGLSLIVPGLSSSSFLIFLGLYEPLTAGIAALDFSIIGPFLIGISATVLLFARLVTMLFEKHYSLVSKIILGFVIASSLKILPTEFANPLTLVIAIICFVVGFIIARSMDYSKEKNKI